MSIGGISGGSFSFSNIQSQFAQQRAAQFAEDDADSSGGLSLDEFKAAHEKRTGGAEKPAGAPSVEEIFSSLDSELAQSYDRLDEWQAEHGALLLDRLVGLVRGMNEAQLRVTLALVMERAGYTHIENHDSIGDESVNFTASSTRGFSSERVVVRLLKPNASATSQAVATLRGGLHTYTAERGILVALGGIDRAAMEQADVANVAPIDLVDATEMARLMLETEVGVRRYHVVTACLDDTFFSG